jgi:hypothetical protein
VDTSALGGTVTDAVAADAAVVGVEEMRLLLLVGLRGRGGRGGRDGRMMGRRLSPPTVL